MVRFRGWMQADGYAGFEDRSHPGAVRYDAWRWSLSGASLSTSTTRRVPSTGISFRRFIPWSMAAQKTIGRIAQFHVVEQEVRGSARPPAGLRRTQAVPPLGAFWCA